MEGPLEKVLRLAAVVQQDQRSAPPTKKPAQTQPGNSGPSRFGTPYRVAWSNVNVGDVLQIGKELWKIIPATAYKGSNPPATKMPTGANDQPGTGPSQPGAPQPGAAQQKPAQNASGGPSQPGGGQQKPGQQPVTPGADAANTASTYTHYLQDVHNPGKHETLTLPGSYVATVVPPLPS